MIPNTFEIAEITITFTSPMIVSNGMGNDINDAICIADANGYPSIPGTSIAGALRHAFASAKNKDLADVIFGCPESEGGKNAGRRSLTTVSWAVPHDSTGRPVSPLIDTNQKKDEVLDFLKAGVHRDHVRINEFGVAADKGKFDELLVPRGARFTFSILLDEDQDSDDEQVNLDDLVNILQEQSFRFGGKTRRGFGAFVVSQVQKRRFNLHNKDDFEAFAKYSFDLSQDIPKSCGFEVDKPSNQAKKSKHILSLKSHDFLLPSGGVGLKEVFSGDDNWEHADIFPVYEYEILWDEQGRGARSKEPHFFLPSTSIKGILRHRTLFYLRVLENKMLDEENKYKRYEKESDRPLSLADILDRQLFGTADKDEQIPGVVLVSEPIFKKKDNNFRSIQHVALDKFTNAPLTGALFTEMVLETFDQDVEIQISVDWEMLESRKIKDIAKIEDKRERKLSPEELKMMVKALNQACLDIAEGRLPLGGGTSRGHGRMIATKPFQQFQVEG